MTTDIDWCSQSEAARRLTASGDQITQQQVSRYLDRWPDIPRRAGENGQAMQVDFGALQLHRQQNVIVQERQPAKASEEPDIAATLRLRERTAAAERAELELQRAKDEVIPRADVERAIQAAAVALRQAHIRTRFIRAEALEATPDQRQKVIALEKQDFEIETAFAQALSALATPKSEEEEAEAEEAREIEEAQSIDDEEIAAHTPPS